MISKKILSVAIAAASSNPGFIPPVNIQYRDDPDLMLTKEQLNQPFNAPLPVQKKRGQSRVFLHIDDAPFYDVDTLERAELVRVAMNMNVLASKPTTLKPGDV